MQTMQYREETSRSGPPDLTQKSPLHLLLRLGAEEVDEDMGFEGTANGLAVTLYARSRYGWRETRGVNQSVTPR
jgi:hypothetical protein